MLKQNNKFHDNPPHKLNHQPTFLLLGVLLVLDGGGEFGDDVKLLERQDAKSLDQACQSISSSSALAVVVGGEEQLQHAASHVCSVALEVRHQRVQAVRHGTLHLVRS